ncbi:hypothetical protein Pelo_4903 [Pelomyxa schiedti]|nr:hypothetical protein Pelo_4903 [Pelomyxa schiedti]
MSFDDDGWGAAASSASAARVSTGAGAGGGAGMQAASDAMQRAGTAVEALRGSVGLVGTGRDSQRVRDDVKHATATARAALADANSVIASLETTVEKAKLDKIKGQYKDLVSQLDSLDKSAKQKMQENKLLVIEMPSGGPTTTSTAAAAPDNSSGELQQVTIVHQDATKKMIEQRNTEFRELANEVTALRDVIKETNELIGEQGEQLNTAAVHVEDAKENVHEAKEALQEAEGYANKARIKIAIVVVIVLVVIAAAILIALGVTHNL